MKIAVGSTNPVKVTAVRQVTLKKWPDADVTAVNVPSGVSEMPMSDAEAISGARNRALAAKAALGADLGVGLEGGVQLDDGRLLLGGWVVVVDGNGREGIGGAGRLPLPPIIANRVLAGEELGPVMDDLVADHNTKQKAGAVGLLTAGLAPRADAFALGVAYALAPFVSPDFYEKK
ncbi:MAG: inosine/xanthosine triphosphatase [Anaerolineae bacterium]